MQELSKFKEYIQKRGRGVKFPLNRIDATDYIKGCLPKALENMLLKPYLVGDLVLVYDHGNVGLWEKTWLIDNYKLTEDIRKCSHNFIPIKLKDIYFNRNPEWKECQKCKHVIRYEEI